MTVPVDGAHPGTPAYRRIVVGFFAAGVATWAQIFAVQGVLPSLTVEMGIPVEAAAGAVSATTLGVAVGVLPWAYVSDRIGRAQAMRLAVVATLILALGSAFTADLTPLLTIRFLLGVSVAAVPAVAVAHLYTVIGAPYFAGTVGVFVAGNTVGGFLGRAVAAVGAVEFGWRGGLIIVGALGTVAAVAFIALVPLGSTHHAADAPRGVWLNVRSGLMRRLYATGFVVLGCFVGIFNLAAFRLDQVAPGIPELARDSIFLGMLVASLGAAAGGWASTHWSPRIAIVVGAAIGVVGAAIAAIPTIVAVYLGVGVITLGLFIVNAAAYGWVGAAAPGGRSQATALWQLSTQLGNTIVGLVLATVFAQIGWPAALVTVAVMLVAVVTLIGTARR